MDWKKLLGSITESVDEELLLRNAYLVAENRMLRQPINGRVQLTDSDRTTLAELGQQLGKKALAEIATVAKPDTMLAWHRTCAERQCDRSQPSKSVGRPRIAKEIEDLVVWMARENRSWGYDRIVGALANLGYRMSDQRVGNILKRHSIPPAPARKTTVTWREFIHVYARGITAPSGWRPCPRPRPLSVYNPYIPQALPPKQRHSSAPARGQALSDTRWTSATSTTARRAAGRQPRSCLSCD